MSHSGSWTVTTMGIPALILSQGPGKSESLPWAWSCTLSPAQPEPLRRASRGQSSGERHQLSPSWGELWARLRVASPARQAGQPLGLCGWFPLLGTPSSSSPWTNPLAHTTQGRGTSSGKPSGLCTLPELHTSLDLGVPNRPLPCCDLRQITESLSASLYSSDKTASMIPRGVFVGRKR